MKARGIRGREPRWWAGVLRDTLLLAESDSLRHHVHTRAHKLFGELFILFCFPFFLSLAGSVRTPTLNVPLTTGIATGMLLEHVPEPRVLFIVQITRRRWLRKNISLVRRAQLPHLAGCVSIWLSLSLCVYLGLGGTRRQKKSRSLIFLFPSCCCPSFFSLALDITRGIIPPPRPTAGRVSHTG